MDEKKTDFKVETLSGFQYKRVLSWAYDVPF